MPKPTRTDPTRPASAAEVARLAGVSRSAVSRTFTDGASVSPETRAKVMEAAKALNYHVNHLARGISKEESRPVCLLAANLNKPYHGLLLDALTRRLQAAGRISMVINVSADPKSAGEALESTLNYRASASVVMSGTPPEAMVKACVGAGQKVILINRSDTFDGVHHIQIDYKQAMMDAVHMLARAGCQRLALASSSKGTPSLVAREEFFVEAAKAQGLAPIICRRPGTNYEDGVQAAREILAGSDRPDGVFGITDLVACGFIDSATRDFGLSIPGDLCVLGFDDIPQSSWQSYGLTTFSQPYDAIAERVSDILLEKTDIDLGARLPAQPRWRNSVRAK